MRPDDAEKKNRRVRRRKKKKSTPPKRYEPLVEFNFYDLLRDRESGVYYIGWYEKSAHQMGRRSLETTDHTIAYDEVQRIDASGMTGDPVSMLHARFDIAKALRDYRDAHADEPSARFNRLVIDNHLIPMVGDIPVAFWRKSDFRRFQTAFLAKGYAPGYFSRICAVLRAALNEAEDDEKCARAPRIPEIMTNEDRDEAPNKGRVMTPEEIAKLIDQVSEPHVLEYLVGAISSAGRPITILESDTTCIDWPASLFDMNPRGRRQNKKHRPAIRIASTWEPWPRAAPPGRLIRYRGKPVKSVKTAIRGARKAAGLKPDAAGINVTSYSIRHSLGRYFEDRDVPPIERSILLGHVKTYNKKTTERYSPTNRRNPNFLALVTKAIEQFVHEINRYTRKWNLLVPHAVKPGYEPTEREKSAIASRTQARRDTTRKREE